MQSSTSLEDTLSPILEAAQARLFALDGTALAAMATSAMRGRPPLLEPDALGGVVAHFLDLAQQVMPGDLAEFEINPLVIGGGSHRSRRRGSPRTRRRHPGLFPRGARRHLRDAPPQFDRDRRGFHPNEPGAHHPWQRAGRRGSPPDAVTVIREGNRPDRWCPLCRRCQRSRWGGPPRRRRRGTRGPGVAGTGGRSRRRPHGDPDPRRARGAPGQRGPRRPHLRCCGRAGGGRWPVHQRRELHGGAVGTLAATTQPSFPGTR